MRKATGIATFIFGVAIGSVATWYLTKKHYQDFADEQIESVKEVFSKRNKDVVDHIEKAVDTIKKAHESTNGSNACADIIEKNGYSERQERPPVTYDEPYVIEPDEFGDIFEYENVDLTYYADGVLTDDYNDPIDKDDIDDMVGADFATHFGEYEDDAVYIRNDRLKSDYAILMDERKSTEVIRYRHQ